MGKPIVSNALAVDPRQVPEANEVAKKLGCGTPFREDGKFEGSRYHVKKYVEGINRERRDGEARIVNYDGGYGDPT